MSMRGKDELRIAQAVPYISSDGAFGGPVSVLMQQSASLAKLGHRVDIFAGWDGKVRPESSGQGFHLHRATRRLSLRLLLAPGMILDLVRRGRRFDVIHLHVGRDLTSLGLMLAAGALQRTFVVQTHGMVMPDSRAVVRLVDRLLVGPTLRRAAAVLVLTDEEDQGLREVARAELRTTRVFNGVEVAEAVSVERPGRPDVLFLGRLHRRKNAPVFVEAGHRVLRAGWDATFSIVGPDDGDLTVTRAAIERTADPRVRYFGAASGADTRKWLSNASIFALPSVGEVVPMAVLEAMSVGTAVVLGEDCGLASELYKAGAARIVESSPQRFAEAMIELLQNERMRREIAWRGQKLVRDRFSAGALAVLLEQIYRSTLTISR